MTMRTARKRGREAESPHHRQGERPERTYGMDKTTPWDMAKTTRHVEADNDNAGKNPQPKRRHKPTYNEIKLK